MADEEIKNILLIDELQSKVDTLARESNLFRVEFKELKESVKNNNVVFKAFEKSYLDKQKSFSKVEQELKVDSQKMWIQNFRVWRRSSKKNKKNTIKRTENSWF